MSLLRVAAFLFLLALGVDILSICNLGTHSTTQFATGPAPTGPQPGAQAADTGGGTPWVGYLIGGGLIVLAIGVFFSAELAALARLPTRLSPPSSPDGPES